MNDYIGKNIKNVGGIFGYNENDNTFSVRVTYCSHIRIKADQVIRLIDDQELYKQVDNITKKYNAE